MLGQKFEDDLERVYRSRRGQRLPDFFANLAPEGPLRDLLVKAASLELGDDLALLAFVGRDLPGAVTVRPLDTEWMRAPVRETLAAVGGDEPAEPAAESEGLRFSLAGVQLKFSMLREAEKLALPAKDGDGHWIVKLDSPTFPHLPENEISMLEWARAAGFDVPECHLHDAEDVQGYPRHFARPGARVLAIRRYDRSAQGRVHQEDFAQAVGLPPTRKYDQVTYDAMAILARRVIGEEAVDEIVRRLVFTIASGNGDAHLKNWSLIYPDRIRARWSPLYDQVATVAWETPERALSLKLGGVKEFSRIDGSVWERFAEKAQVDRRRVLDLLAETLDRLRVAWREVFSGLPLPEAHAEALRAHWKRVPLLRASGALD